MSPFLAQTPQVQLGSITASGGAGSAVIALTPQTAALQIISPATITQLEVVGEQSGAIYYNSAPGTNGITNLPVNQSVDASVTVTITGSGSASVSTVSSAGLIMTGGGSPLASGCTFVQADSNYAATGTTLTFVLTPVNKNDIFLLGVIGFGPTAVSSVVDSVGGSWYDQVVLNDPSGSTTTEVYLGLPPTGSGWPSSAITVTVVLAADCYAAGLLVEIAGAAPSSTVSANSYLTTDVPGAASPPIAVQPKGVLVVFNGWLTHGESTYSWPITAPVAPVVSLASPSVNPSATYWFGILAGISQVSGSAESVAYGNTDEQVIGEVIIAIAVQA